jgi:hypothetical protein
MTVLYSIVSVMQVENTLEIINRIPAKSSSRGELVANLNDRTIANLRHNVEAGYAAFTNNNCESLNHVLKNVGQWRLQKLPVLTASLKVVETVQLHNDERAMYGERDNALKRYLHPKYMISYDDWTKMSKRQRQNHTSSCFRVRSSGISRTSTDGDITISQSSNAGREHLQMKRPSSDRTTTKTR